MVIVMYYNSDWKAVPARWEGDTKKNRKVVSMVSEGGSSEGRSVDERGVRGE